METEPFFSLLINLNTGSISFNSLTVGIIISIIVLIVLLIFSALLSGSEVAYFSLKPAEIQELKDVDSRNSRLVISLLKAPEKLLATILIGNNFVNVGIVILSAFITNELILFHGDLWVKFLYETVGITALILFFGEILPKVYASQLALKFVRFVAYPLYVLRNIFKPLSAILVSSSNFVNKRIAKKINNISLDDISQALEITGNEITEEKEILEGIVKFGNISAAEIMTSRVDVIDIDYTESYENVLKIVTDSGFSRIPIYENTPDKVKGVLYVKDLLPHLNKPKDFEWQKLMREAYFIPETKKINDLLEEFQHHKVHLAIVVDEYGGTCGIVSLEDILEEIVGEITDEQDEEESFYAIQPDGSIIFEGKTILNDFYRITHINEEEFTNIKGDAETLAGLILEIKGEIPNIKEEIKFKNYLFTITNVDSRKINKIKFEIINKK